MTKVIGIWNKDATAHKTLPIKFLRYAEMKKGENRQPDRYFVKALGMADRIEVNKETYEQVVEALELA